MLIHYLLGIHLETLCVGSRAQKEQRTEGRRLFHYSKSFSEGDSSGGGGSKGRNHNFTTGDTLDHKDCFLFWGKPLHRIDFIRLNVQKGEMIRRKFLPKPKRVIGMRRKQSGERQKKSGERQKKSWKRVTIIVVLSVAAMWQMRALGSFFSSEYMYQLRLLRKPHQSAVVLDDGASSVEDSDSIYGSGTLVRKKFENGEYYVGEVTGYDPHHKRYQILYSNSKTEDLDQLEVKTYLLLSRSNWESNNLAQWETAYERLSTVNKEA